MGKQKLTYDELETRLGEAEKVITALRKGHVDAVVGEHDLLLIRLREVEEELRRSRDELEQKVKERTTDLENINRQLSHEIEVRTSAELSSKRSEQLLRALSAKIESIREEERTRISREIHDELGHLLTALKFDLSTFGSNLDKDHPYLMEELNSMHELIDKSIETTRKIATELRPGILDKFGIGAAIEWHLKEFQARTGKNIQSDLDEVGMDIGEQLTTTIYRIYQEILTNVAIHSGATEVKITLKKLEKEIRLEVNDNGIGIKPEKLENTDSLGILGMRERAEILGGKFRISGTEGKGTNVFVSIPFE